MARKKIEIGQTQFGFPDEDLKTSLHDEIVIWIKNNAKVIAKRLMAHSDSWDPKRVEDMRSKHASMVEDRISLLSQKIEERKLKHEIFSQLTKELDSSFQESETLELSALELWPGLGGPPPPRLEVQSEMELPIERELYKKQSIVGYVDIMIRARATELSAGFPPSDNWGNPVFGIDPASYLKWQDAFHNYRDFAFDAKGKIPSLGELIRQFKTYKFYLPHTPFYIVSPETRFAELISDEGFGFISYPDGAITPPKRRTYR